MSNLKDRTLAMAGLIQSCMQVEALAQQGQWHESLISSPIYSLFQIDADSVTDIYGSPNRLAPGLTHLKAMLEKRVQKDQMDITRYTLTLVHLEKKLSANQQMMDKIRQGLYQIKNEFDIQDLSNITLFSRLADIYASTISTIPPKIQVQGQREHLTQLNNTFRIRSLLFAGMRSAVLWRQMGGSRWDVFWRRRQYLDSIDQILQA